MKWLLVVIVVAMAAGGCVERQDSHVFTLYRNSTDPNMRVHVATFDADQAESYNADNCERAKELFQAQPFIEVRYWCEKGFYRK